MTAKNHKFGKADQQLDEILGRVKYIGPEPPPSEDEAMDMVVQEIRAARRAEPPLPGEIEALDEAKAEFAEGKTNRLDDLLRHLSPRNG